MMATLKVALLQIADQGSTDANLEHGLEACAAAAGRGAGIALLPEIWSHGYRFFAAGDAEGEAGWRASALAEASAFVGEHRRAARKLGLAIGCTYLEASPAGPRNSLALIDRRGEIVLRYSKVHICLHTVERHCVPGDRFRVATLATAAGEVVVGAMICYDREFPESARILGLKGAEVVLVPNACLFDDHRRAQLKTRAFENKVVIAMTNYPNSHPDCDGRSLGISAMAFGETAPSRTTPTNRQAPSRETVLVEAGGEPGIYDFVVDLEELRRYRRNAIWGAPHRQVDAYADLVADGFGKDFRPDHIIS
jgi:predicted amidohydrolase